MSAPSPWLKKALEPGPAVLRPALGAVLPVAAALVVVGLVGVLDFTIGLSFRLYPLYIPPIAWTTWRVGTGAGVSVALASVASCTPRSGAWRARTP